MQQTPSSHLSLSQVFHHHHWWSISHFIRMQQKQDKMMNMMIEMNCEARVAMKFIKSIKEMRATKPTWSSMSHCPSVQLNSLKIQRDKNCIVKQKKRKNKKIWDIYLQEQSHPTDTWCFLLIILMLWWDCLMTNNWWCGCWDDWRGSSWLNKWPTHNLKPADVLAFRQTRAFWEMGTLRHKILLREFSWVDDIVATVVTLWRRVKSIGPRPPEARAPQSF